MKHGLESFYTLIESLEALPTIGKKSAKMLALHMIKHDQFGAIKLAHAIEEAVRRTKTCSKCGALSEHELCEICADENRDHHLLCIVSSAKDIFTLEDSGHFHGRYFVFEAIEVERVERLKQIISEGITEIIFAFPPSLQNDALIFYIEEQLKTAPLTFTKIAQGVPTGVNLENVDTLSLARALESRTKI